MIILIGLVILVAAVVVGAAGVLANEGAAHSLNGAFSVFGYHFTGSTGTLFLYGMVVGAVGVCGLSLLLSGARRTARRGRLARRELKQARRDTASVSQDRDELLEQQRQRETDNIDAAQMQGGPRHEDSGNDRVAGGHRNLNPFSHRSRERAPANANPGRDNP